MANDSEAEAESLTDDEILKNYIPWLETVARGMCRNRTLDYKDVAQEGLLAMWKALKSNNPGNGAPLDFWLKKNARWAMYSIVLAGVPGTPKASRAVPWTTSIEYGHGKPRAKDETPFHFMYDTECSDNEVWKLLEVADSVEWVAERYHDGEIVQAINSLSPEQRELVFRRFWQGEPLSSDRESYSEYHSMWKRTKTELAKKLAHLSTV